MYYKIIASKISLIAITLLFISLVSCKRISISTLTEPVLGMEFIHIRRGSFQMGNYENDNGIASLHKVKLSKDFWIGKTEVTQDQWFKIMGNEEIHPNKPSPFRGLNPNYPVVSVSYLDIEIFLEKLNELAEGFKFRIPTEAEWEYACRAGTKTPFSYGSYLVDTLANYNAKIPSQYSVPGMFLGHPKPVGSYPVNQWGLHDMHGNVWEWVSDWYAPYSKNKVIDPSGPTSGKEKVIRGGSWYYGAENAKSSHRRIHTPKLWGFSIGFRLICEKEN